MGRACADIERPPEAAPARARRRRHVARRLCALCGAAAREQGVQGARACGGQRRGRAQGGESQIYL